MSCIDDLDPEERRVLFAILDMRDGNAAMSSYYPPALSWARGACERLAHAGLLRAHSNLGGGLPAYAATEAAAAFASGPAAAVTQDDQAQAA